MGDKNNKNKGTHKKESPGFANDQIGENSGNDGLGSYRQKGKDTPGKKK